MNTGSDRHPELPPAAAFALAEQRFAQGDAAGARAICETLSHVVPANVGLCHLAGLAAFALGRFAEAAAHFEAACALDPSSAGHLINLANAYMRLDRDDAAEQSLVAALARDSGSAECWIAMGILARRRGDLERAVAHADQALALTPASYEAWVNRGRALHELGRFALAIESFDRGIAIRPEAAPAHGGKAIALLLTGDFRRGWAEYEWRGEGRDLAARARFAEQEWRGEPFGGTLLVHAEQGFGDTVQFARFLPLAARRGIDVVAEVQPALKALLQGLEPVIRVRARGEALPPFDRQIRLMSLPHVLGIDNACLPPPVSLSAPKWAGSLPPDPKARPTVGLAWAGNPDHENDRNRSIPPNCLAPVGAVEGIRFVSLQFGQTSAPAFPLVQPNVTDGDFAGSAAVMRELDLLITIDSAPAHLMGSLDRPVWVLLPDPPDWRWLLGRDDSPWYPNARLFRQEKRGDWSAPLERIAAGLRHLRQHHAGASEKLPGRD